MKNRGTNQMKTETKKKRQGRTKKPRRMKGRSRQLPGHQLQQTRCFAQPSPAQPVQAKLDPAQKIKKYICFDFNFFY